MSKNPVIKAMKMQDTGERKLVPIKAKIHGEPDFALAANHMSVLVSAEYSGFVVDDLSSSTTNKMEEFFDSAKRGLVETFYGIYRQDLLEIERALYDNDLFTARTKLAELYKDMFNG